MNNFEVVKSKIDLASHIKKYVDLQETPSGYKSCCPMHEEKSPSFFLYEIEGEWRWTCKGACDTGGDIFDFETFMGHADDNVEAMRKIANEYGIQIDSLPVAQANRTVEALKADVTEYVHKLLMNNETAKNFLRGRGITDAMMVKWKIGISDGKLYEHFSKKYTDKTGPINELLVQSGIADEKNGNVRNFIRENILMYPVYVDKIVSHWDLRECSNEKKYNYQIPKKKRGEGIFFNQNRLKQKEFWIVEGRDDVVMMEEHGYHTIGLMGKSSNQQIDTFKALAEFNANYPDDLATKRRIHILMDRDQNNSGQREADKLAGELCDFHEVTVHILPEWYDPHEYLKEGYSIEELEVRKVEPGSTMISERNNQYYYHTKEESYRVISNFSIKLDYEIMDDDGWKSYIVQIVKDGENDGPYILSSKNWSGESRFREWIGQCGGQYAYKGSGKELPELVQFLFEKQQPKRIREVDGYGEVVPGVRVFDNGVIVNGNRTKANKLGVSWVGHHGIDGIRTATWNAPSKRFDIPEETFEIKDIIAGIKGGYHSPHIIWPIIGYASACIYYNHIANHFGYFPVYFLTGPQQAGKTNAAEVIASLTGAGSVDSPSIASTDIGLRRMVSAYHGFALVINEAKGEKLENMVRSWFDRNPQVKGVKSNDRRTTGMQFNSAGVFTHIHHPNADDVISRCLMHDFSKFKKGTGVAVKNFQQFYKEGVQRNKNFSFMEKLTGTEFSKTVLNKIEKVQDAFIEQGIIENARPLTCVSIVAGAFVQAYESLNLEPIFKELDMDLPSEAEIVNIFSALSATTMELMQEVSEMRIFFEILDGIYHNGSGYNNEGIDSGFDSQGAFIRFHLSGIYGDVIERDSRRGRKLEGISQSWIRRRLKEDFGCIAEETKRINGKSCRMHKIYVEDIRKIYSFVFDIGDIDEGDE